MYRLSSELEATGIILGMMTTPEKAADPQKNPVTSAVGKTLKKHRLSLNVSQVNLASKAELDRAFISRIERGLANPSVTALANICYGLGITLADFFSEMHLSLRPEPDKPRRANAARPKISPPRSRLR